VSVQYGSLSESIASQSNSVAGIIGGPNRVVKHKPSMCLSRVRICSGLYLQNLLCGTGDGQTELSSFLLVIVLRHANRRKTIKVSHIEQFRFGPFE
jgi:hypothetical protein